MANRQNLNLGRSGEDQAVKALKEKGYKILLRNYRTKLGEIDIIAEDRGTICFVEVKARISDRQGAPAESVSPLKQGQISKAAVLFLKEKNLLNRKARFDVVTVKYSQESPEVGLIKNAFELDGRFTY